LVECTQLSTSDVKEREIKKEIKKTLWFQKNLSNQLKLVHLGAFHSHEEHEQFTTQARHRTQVTKKGQTKPISKVCCFMELKFRMSLITKLSKIGSVRRNKSLASLVAIWPLQGKWIKFA
jgi:hypothetical protein